MRYGEYVRVSKVQSPGDVRVTSKTELEYFKDLGIQGGASTPWWLKSRYQSLRRMSKSIRDFNSPLMVFQSRNYREECFIKNARSRGNVPSDMVR